MPTPARHNTKAAARRGLDRVSDALLTLEVADPERLLCTMAAARERADRALAAFGAGDPAVGSVVYDFAGGVLASLAGDRDVSSELLARAFGRLRAARVLSPLAAGREGLRSPALVALEPGRALAGALRMIGASGGTESVSLWALGPTGELTMLHGEGQRRARAAEERVARELIGGEPARPGPAGPLGVAILRAGLPTAALLARPRKRAVRATAALLAEAAAPLAAILERETLLARNASSERALVQAGERRLTRLGFDLHDGPLQELLLVGEDLALFREQLGVVLEGRSGKELLGGRLDDLDARLAALERGLRRISTSVHAGVMVDRPFADAFEDLLAPFRSRTGIAPQVELAGDLDGISQSQRMALLSVTGEALNNIREHSGAASVSIAIVADEQGARARIADDGSGFDVEEELLRAARRGHMGLAGVYERVRLLGGHCRIESRPGGPSEIAIALPRWQAPGSERVAAAG